MTAAVKWRETTCPRLSSSLHTSTISPCSDLGVWLFGLLGADWNPPGSRTSGLLSDRLDSAEWGERRERLTEGGGEGGFYNCHSRSTPGMKRAPMTFWFIKNPSEENPLQVTFLWVISSPSRLQFVAVQCSSSDPQEKGLSQRKKKWNRLCKSTSNIPQGGDTGN